MAQGILDLQAVESGLISAPFCCAASWAGSRLFRQRSDEFYRLVALVVLELSALVSICLGVTALFSVT